MADRSRESRRTRKLGTVLLVACVVGGIALIASLSPFFVGQYSIASLTQGLEHYFVYDDGRGQQYVISAQVKKDRSVTQGYVKHPIIEFGEARGSDPLDSEHPEAVEKIVRACKVIDEKAASYLVQYPKNRIVDCTILAFSEEGITVSFEGLGILEDGSYAEIEDTVTQLFEL